MATHTGAKLWKLVFDLLSKAVFFPRSTGRQTTKPQRSCPHKSALKEVNKSDPATLQRSAPISARLTSIVYRYPSLGIKARIMSDARPPPNPLPKSHRYRDIGTSWLRVACRVNSPATAIPVARPLLRENH